MSIFRNPAGLAARLLVIAALTLIRAGTAHAEVLGDNRLDQLEGLPTLGRGYDTGSNTLHSVCFESVKASDPVFDFYYEFDKVDDEYLQQIGTRDGNWALNGELSDFLHDHIREPGSTPAGDEIQQVNIVARITLESYHKTLDESASPVAKSTRTLVEEGRYTAFFNACGFFYVRSLRYSSTFMALFQFARTSSGEEDARFERLLRSELFEFGEDEPESELDRAAAARDLRVYVRGAGLGRASQLANLVPTTLREFRQAIQAAAQLMQSASSGVITSLELAPWIEHPELRSYFFKTQQGESTFGKTQRLELNSQVITAINMTRKHFMEEYYLASLCRDNLFEYYPIDASGISGQFDVIYDPRRTLFENHRHQEDSRRRITLQQFRDYFTKVPPSSFLDKANRFVNGSGKGDGAEACIDALVREGLDRAEFSRVPSCVAAMREANVQDRFLRNFCLPTPVTRVYKSSAP